MVGERAVASVGLIRLRVAVLAVMMVVLALAAGRIFDSVRGALVVGAIVPTVLMFVGFLVLLGFPALQQIAGPDPVTNPINPNTEASPSWTP